MPTNAEIIGDAMGRLGSRTSPKVRAVVVKEINKAIDKLERGTFFPWFLEKTDQLAVVADDTFKALASDFAIEAEESRPYFTLNGKIHYLTKRFHAALQGATPSGVQFYAIRGNEFHFRKAADQALTINVPYMARETGNLVDDSAEVSNLWLINAFEWVSSLALKQVAALHLHDVEQASVFQGMEIAAKNELYVFHEARVHTNQDYEMGGASDGS